jgi:hypothetical protein
MPRKNDPQSVKDALTGRDITDLNKSITDLATAMKEGFAGMHLRQDTTNGKVLKAGSDIIELKSDTDKKFDAIKFKFQYNKIIWYLFTVAATVIVGLVMYIITHH